MNVDAVLHYSNPKAFFAGSYRFRSRRGVMLLSVALTCAVTFGSMSFGVPPLRRPTDVPSRIMAWAFAGAGAASLAAVIYMLVQIAVRGEVAVRVTEHGLERGRRSWGWGDVAEFGGARDAEKRAGVWLTFRPRGRPLDVPLDLTPRLSEQEFRELAGDVAAYLAKRYPHVRVELEPRLDEGGG